MGAPSINILFKQAGATAIKRGDRGVVVLILKDTVPAPLTNPIKMASVADIPSALTADNKAQITLAFMGYVNSPKNVIAYIVPVDTTDYTIAQHYLETIKWNYLAFPEIADADVTAFATWIKSLRDTIDKRVKAVLPNCVGDHEGIINYTNEKNVEGSITYTAKQYCSRIAGMLAGTPLTISATYAPLSELNDCDHLTKAEMDTAVDAGKLILMNDGEKVKIVRAVNSLTTTTTGKGSLFKKIKIVDIMDQIHDDIKATVSDNYIGKIQNDYDHKVLLISAIGGYFDQLELDGLLDKGKSSVYIDLEAQEAYLKSIGVDTSTMSVQQIKEANTEDKVFIAAKAKILDAMEDFNMSIGI
ncbi:phage tail sheath C-terminal domain-containing protein [Clostridium sp. JN-9]|uniref:phage tail sheath C-terminal domain-containing protein n=1 Tax=Clostridium sp. JN-9 TaxID=2507159 RepID=UPI000FFE2178|nr:phage tail sheath C-terminal domain-containing protein [Clostridium sp. JN-9]QAT40836.1 phage tail sheath protein [Clostridium sp. JN-9]